MLPKRDSFFPGYEVEIDDVGGGGGSDDHGVDDEQVIVPLYSEQTLAFASVTSAVIALIVGFVFGILVTRDGIQFI